MLLEPSAHPDTRSGMPGRLGDPATTPATDPRVDPALAQVLSDFEMDTVELLPDPGQERADLAAAVAEQSHVGTEYFYESVPLSRYDDTVTDVHVERLTVPTGAHDVDVAVHRVSTAPAPGLVYFHGGAMTFASTFNRVHDQWCTDLAAAGVTVVQVDFRNAWTDDGFNPYPAGLDDCVAALRWVVDHADQLGITSVVVQGESGGGNLALAAALRARAEGWSDRIAGVYAKAPFISGRYGAPQGWRQENLPSLLINDGYAGMDAYGMDAMVAMYDPTGAHHDDPMAWPYTAGTQDLSGLPPHVIDVDGLDPLVDEGLHYARQLARAGVPVVAHLQPGLTHCADHTFRAQLPLHNRALVGRVVTFATAIAPSWGQDPDPTLA